MTILGIQTLLPLVGIRSAFAQHEIMLILQVLHVLGNSYRLATLGSSSIVAHGRFTLGFCSVVVAVALNVLASRLSASGELDWQIAAPAIARRA